MSETTGIASQFPGPAARLLPLLDDEEITDVLLNGTTSAYVERAGELVPIPHPFPSVEEMDYLVERMLFWAGKRPDALRPFCDGQLADGSRFHVVLRPMAPDGPIISIRRHGRAGRGRAPDAFGAPSAVAWLRAALDRRDNLLIAGGTGAGKTSLLESLLGLVSPAERLLVLEESRELAPGHPHAVFLETRPPSPEGEGGIDLRTLVRCALRMRPDRMVIGECRGAEAFDLLGALASGHRGSLCTVHAGSAREALLRLEALALTAGGRLSPGLVRRLVAGGIQGVVWLERRHGARVIGEIARVSGLEGAVYRMERVYPA